MIWILIPALVVSGVVFHYILRFTLSELATRNIFFTLKTQSEFIPIVRGKSLVEFIYSIPGHKLDKNFDLMPLGANEAPVYSACAPDFKPTWARNFLRWFFEKYYGIIWVGLPPFRVFEYQFSWVKYDNKDTATDFSMEARGEIVDSVFWTYSVYGLEIDDAETGAGVLAHTKGGEKQKIGVEAGFVFETETLNPHHSLFRGTGFSTAGDWILAVSAELRKRLKPWIGSRTYEELISMFSEPESATGTTVPVEDFSHIKEIVNADIQKYGQVITKLRFVNVDIKDKVLRDKANALFSAEQDRLAAEKEKETRILKAQASKEEAEQPLIGRANGYKKIKESGGEGMYVAEQVGHIHTYAPGGRRNNILIGSDSGPSPTPPSPQPNPQSAAEGAIVTAPQTTETEPPEENREEGGKKWKKKRRKKHR